MATIDEVADSGTIPHHSLLALVWTCFSAAALFLAIRTVIRLRVARGLTTEDYWMFLALATLLTLCILETVQLPSLYYMTAAMGGDVALSLDLIDHTENYLRFQFPVIILFWSTLWCVKAGFLALYFRLFRELPLYRRVWYVLAIFTLLAYAGCVVSLSLSCGKPSNFFKFARCGTQSNIWRSNLSVYYSTAVDVFTDLCIMAMPLRLIINVKISLRQKVGLMCVFGLGFVMIAFAIIRAKQVLVEQYFVNLTLLMIWSTLASSIAVIVGSLPAFRLLVTNRTGSTNHSAFGSSGGRSNKKHISNNTDLNGKSVPLGSLSSQKRSPISRCPDPGDSQEEIIRSDGTQFVMVNHDLENGSHHEMESHSSSDYHPQKPSTGYGRAV